MKLRTFIIIIILIGILVAIKMIFLKPEEGAGPGGGKGGNPKDQTFNVTGYIVQPQVLENKIFSSGTVMANEEVILRPEVSGKLILLNIKEGTNVSKGTLLAKINDNDLQAQLKKSEVQLKLAKEKESRLKGLLGIKGVSQQEYDIIANELESISADMDFIKAQIAKTEVHAPFSGKMGLKQISEGSFVTNTSILASMQQTDILKLDFTVPEKYASILSTGDNIKFNVANQKEQFTAKVFAIEPRIDPQTRNITIRAIFNNSNGKIYPGSFAKVELIASKQGATIMIPTQAVIPELKGNKVYISKSGKAMPTKIEIGTRTDKEIEVTSGLSAGDTVIVTGIMSLKPEAKVKIINLKK
jgi:membrane fusion protein (multidrug efflux system)